MTANTDEKETKELDIKKKGKGIKYLIIFSILSLITVIAIIICKIQSDIEDVYSPTQVKKQAKSESTEMSEILGRWQRTDGEYVIEIRSVDPYGIMDASYFNPNPINISQSKAKDSGGMLEIYIELWDENYPGSTYTLRYDSIRDILFGSYYTPVAGQSFEVLFVRIE